MSSKRRTYIAAVGTVFLALFAVACSDPGSSSAGAAAEEVVLNGQAFFRDSQTDTSGTEHAPKAVAAQSVSVQVQLQGQGWVLTPTTADSCVAQSEGSFEGQFQATGKIDSTGAFKLQLPADTGIFTLGPGCRASEMSFKSLAQVKIVASLAGTPENCAAQCWAHGRAECELGCPVGSPGCRPNCENKLLLRCQECGHKPDLPAIEATAVLTPTQLEGWVNANAQGAPLTEFSGIALEF